MDVIEEGRTNKLSAFKFLNQDIYLQTGLRGLQELRISH